MMHSTMTAAPEGAATAPAEPMPAARLGVVPDLCECGTCGLVQRLPRMPRNRIAECTRCGDHLRRTRIAHPLRTPLAFALTSAVLYVLCCIEPLMTLDVHGRQHAVTILTGPIELAHEGFFLLSVLVALATVGMPALTIALVIYVLISVRRGHHGEDVTEAMRLYERLRPWSMIEVYMLGVFVAYTKMIDLATVHLDVAVYGLAALMLTQASTDSALDPHVVWQRIGAARRLPPEPEDVGDDAQAPAGAGNEAAHHYCACPGCGLICTDRVPDDSVDRCFDLGRGYRCPRCDTVLRRRKADPLPRCVALLVAAVGLYLPANILPVMDFYKLQRGGGDTILSGVKQLYDSGMLPLALLVFFASITVPVLKIGALAWMTFCMWRKSARGLVARSKLFRIVVFIGRWSMIDVFMISILVALVRYGALANIKAEPGAFCFAAVVVVTIVAADVFDPRVMWDVAGYNSATLWGPGRRRRLRDRIGILPKRSGKGREGEGRQMEPVRA